MARTVIKGIPVSPGVAIGPLILGADSILYEKRAINPEDAPAEIESLKRASQKVIGELEQSFANLPENVEEYKDIILAQMELARDPRLIGSASARIKRRNICAAWALAETVDELCSLFKSMSDPYLSDRGQDIKIIGASLADALNGITHSVNSISNGILATTQLSAGEMLKMKMEGLQGLITADGGVTSHTAILARGLKIPAIIGVANLFELAASGETVIMDGLSGAILVDPDEKDLQKYSQRKNNYAKFEKQASQAAEEPAITQDGLKVSVAANLENIAELASVKKSGYEGIGLYRTEFSFLENHDPDEEKLVEEYRSVVNTVAPRTVIFRTLDVGADKMLPANEALHESNPALGLRGIRFCLRHKELLERQIRALLRCAPRHKISIMLPMVTIVNEITEVRQLIQEIKTQLAHKNVPYSRDVALGVMIETPAAVMICDELVKHCDFISIGTNDLFHYQMAIDRNNRHVAYLHEPLQPALARSIKMIAKAAKKQGIEVSVCGELAADPFGLIILLGCGIANLSVAPRFVPGIKHILRKLDSRVCAKMAEAITNEFNTDFTRQKLHDLLQQCLGDDLAFHNTILSGETQS